MVETEVKENKKRIINTITFEKNWDRFSFLHLDSILHKLLKLIKKNKGSTKN